MTKEDKEIIKEMFIVLYEIQGAIWDKISDKPRNADKRANAIIVEISKLVEKIKVWENES